MRSFFIQVSIRPKSLTCRSNALCRRDQANKKGSLTLPFIIHLSFESVGQIKTIQIHDFIPSGNEVKDELGMTI